jgi:hypothetical protein
MVFSLVVVVAVTVDWIGLYFGCSNGCNGGLGSSSDLVVLMALTVDWDGLYFGCSSDFNSGLVWLY